MNREDLFPKGDDKMFIMGKLVDGKGGYSERALLEIRGERIARMELINPKIEPDSLDVGEMFILPGLIDAHLHLWGSRTMDFVRETVVPEEMNLLRAVQDLNKLVDAGYTSIRDAGSRGGISLRNAVNEGTLRGPRIKTPGLAITQTGGHLDKHFIPLDEAKGTKTVCRIADGPDDCRRAVREQFRGGADYIKICVTGGLGGEKESIGETQLSDEEIKVIVEEAEKKNRKVSAHAQGLSGIKKAIRWGVHFIEHGIFLDEETCEQMIRGNVILTPTLSISYKFAVEGEEHGAMSWAIEKAKFAQEAHVKSFQMAHRAGVKMAAGSDFSGAPMVPHDQNALELELMVKAGCSPMEAINAATKTGSEVLGISSEVGTLETGKCADLIVIDGNPIEDISILQDSTRIRFVMKGGQILKNTLRTEGTEIPGRNRR
jgi:imidazolonepropionase-like amidohydrolase